MNRSSGIFARLLWVSALPLSILFVSFCAYVYSHIEARCFWDPWIETRAAPNYSEKQFLALKVGASTNELTAKLGQPLFTTEWGTNEAWHYTYTDDARCAWGDWAWMDRWVVVSNGVVAEVIQHVFDD